MDTDEDEEVIHKITHVKPQVKQNMKFKLLD